MNTFPDIFNCKGFEAQKRQTLNSIWSALALNILKYWRNKPAITSNVRETEITGPQQQFRQKFTVKLSGLESVDTTDAGAAWREEQMTSTKKSL